jgi:hypothetical protein
MLCTSLYAARQAEETVRSAADCICRDFTRQLTGRRPADSDFRTVTKLGEQIADGAFSPIAGMETSPILMRYDQ